MSISTSSDRVKPLKQTANFQTQTEAENFRPKRKSGSFSGLYSHAFIPPFKQKGIYFLVKLLPPFRKENSPHVLSVKNIFIANLAKNDLNGAQIYLGERSYKMSS